MREISKYQQDICDVYDSQNCNIVIKAGPGSGKSHTIRLLIDRTPRFKKVLCVAFNKSIADELSKDMPGNVTVSTIHSACYRVLRANTRANFKVNSFKTYALSKKHLKLDDLRGKSKDSYLFTISKIIDLARMHMVHEYSEIEALCDEYGICVTRRELMDVLEMMVVLKSYNNRQHKEFMLDFTDMLSLTYQSVSAQKFTKYHVVFVDETQDLNPLQKMLLENFVHKSGRIVCVGDERQSIYNFMGANLDSLHAFENMPNTKVMPLSVTYRCGSNIVDMANDVFPGLESLKSLDPGVVRSGSIDEAQPGDYVLCRNNLPLARVFIHFLKNGKRSMILGRDFCQSLIMLIGRLQEYDSYDDGRKAILEDRTNQLMQRVTDPTKASSYRILVERLDVVKELMSHFGSLHALSENVEQIYSDDTDNDSIILSTIHKAKGLESDRVFFHLPELIPSKYAQTENELYQEKCLRYVAITRAKKELIFC